MQKTITLFEKTIRQDENGRYCLNDLHKAAMANDEATPNHRPTEFLRSEPVKEFLGELEKVGNSHIKTARGRNGGTYATELVALRYAGWISAKVEVEVYKTFQKVANADEGLTHDLIERQADPEAQKRIAARAQSKMIRQTYTDGLKDHGVTGKGYALCTNAIYDPIFGYDAKGMRKAKNLPKTANLRDTMDRRELVTTMFAEEVALARLERERAHGNSECAKHSRAAAMESKNVMDGVQI